MNEVIAFLAGLQPHTLRTIRAELRERDAHEPTLLLNEITDILRDLDGDDDAEMNSRY